MDWSGNSYSETPWARLYREYMRWNRTEGLQRRVEHAKRLWLDSPDPVLLMYAFDDGEESNGR